MSTRAKSLVPAATRAIASGDPLAMLVVTASAFRAEQAAGGGHHERRGRGIDRTVERKLDRERRPGFVRGRTWLAVKPAIAHSPAREASENARERSGESGWRWS